MESVYQLKDIGYMEDLLPRSQEQLTEIQLVTPQENGMQVGSPIKKRKATSPLKTTAQKRIKTAPLPTRKYGRPKHPFSGRVGQHAVMMRAHYSVFVPVDGSELPGQPKVSAA